MRNLCCTSRCRSILCVWNLITPLHKSRIIPWYIKNCNYFVCVFEQINRCLRVSTGLPRRSLRNILLLWCGKLFIFMVQFLSVLCILVCFCMYIFINLWLHLFCLVCCCCCFCCYGFVFFTVGVNETNHIDVTFSYICIFVRS